MRAEVARDLTRSALAFKELVWPAIGGWLGGGELTPVESVSAEGFAKELDMLAGIDAWHIRDSRIRGIASRVQFLRGGRLPYNTFTIRRSRITENDTEYAKRLYAISHPHAGWLYPSITVQAYVEGQNLVSAAAVFTADLIRHIENGVEGIDYWVQSNEDGRSDFYAVRWSRLQAVGILVRTLLLESALCPAR